MAAYQPLGWVNRLCCRGLLKALVLSLVFMSLPRFVAAQTLPDATGPILLVVTGQIEVFNAGDRAEFDLQMLKNMPATSLRTTTPWTEGQTDFQGVALSDLLDLLGVQSGVLEAEALNKYRIEIPVDDAFDADPLIAYLRDNEPMSVREKGPLWIVYPYDRHSRFNQEIYHSRSIWQLKQIHVKGG